MSVAAASPQHGSMDFDLFETELERAMIALADKVMLLLDSSKWTKPDLIHVCGWSAVDILVTEATPPAAVTGELEHGRIVIAPSAG